MSAGIIASIASVYLGMRDISHIHFHIKQTNKIHLV